MKDKSYINLGWFDSITQVWELHPEGGHEGEYFYVDSKKYRWNKTTRNWEYAATDPVAGGNVVVGNDLTVNNNETVGNDLRVHGNANVERNLFVGGKIYAKGVKQPNLGFFSSEEALKAAYPTPEVGMWASVGETMPGTVWRCETAGVWVNTEQEGGVDPTDVNYGIVNNLNSESTTEALSAAMGRKLQNEKLGVVPQSLTEDQKRQAQVNMGMDKIVDGLRKRTGYFVCSTPWDVKNKSVSAPNFELAPGCCIKIRMIWHNEAENPTLDINNTGARILHFENVVASKDNTWHDNEVIEVYYNGEFYFSNSVGGGSSTFRSGQRVHDIGIDKKPTKGSRNLVESGGVYDSINDLQEDFDELLENYKPIVINGDVTNAPDEEDITMDENSLLKFKNRGTLLGKGYVILRNGIPLEEQMTADNTIYEIRYDFDLGGETLEVPDDCVLRFVGGSISNGTLSGNATTIESDAPCLHELTLSIKLNNGSVHYNWLKEIGDLQSLVDCASEYDGVLDLDESTITIDTPIYIDREVDTKKAYFTIKNGTIIIDTPSAFYSNLSTNYNYPRSEYVRFDNILFKREEGSENIVLRDGDFLRVKIENCEFVGVPLINSEKSYLQSYYIHNCLFRDYSDPLINIASVWDIQFTNNSVERSSSSVFINITDQARELNATNNLAEDLTEFIHVDKATGLNVAFNYFEAVRRSIVTIEHNSSDYVSRGFTFIGNRCSTSTSYAELDDDGKYYYITIGFVKNFTIQGNTFIHSEAENTPINIISIGDKRSYGLFTDYFDTSSNLYKNYRGEINVANSLVLLEGNENYNAILRSGSYFTELGDSDFRTVAQSTVSSIYPHSATVYRGVLNVLSNPINKEKVFEHTVMSEYPVDLPQKYMQTMTPQGARSKIQKYAMLIDGNYGADWNDDDLDIVRHDVFSEHTSFYDGTMRFINGKGLQIWYYDGWSNAYDGVPTKYLRKGYSTDRPELENITSHIGFQFFDRTLGKPIWWDGTTWVDATGTEMPNPETSEI